MTLAARLQFGKVLQEYQRAGNAALFVLIGKMITDKMFEQIKDYGGVVLKTSLTDSNEHALRDALASAGAAPHATGTSS